MNLQMYFGLPLTIHLYLVNNVNRPSDCSLLYNDKFCAVGFASDPIIDKINS